ncbi:hypothetical protein HY734_02810 [Candidatus Uhrbacteria bacterium]|nr:hypothetical protein [Candidatus Uhrbacteria bacterium]
MREKPEIYHADEIPKDIALYLETKGYAIPIVLERNGTEFTIAASSVDLDACDADPSCLAKKLAPYANDLCTNGVCSMKRTG